MRNSFTILARVFVCAVVAVSAPAQSNEISTEASSEMSQARATGSSDLADLSSALISERIGEAKRLLISRNSVQRDLVNLAALDPYTSQINILSLPKEQFLVQGADLNATTQLGLAVHVHIVSANGVNTAVTITQTANGRALTPLVVEFPIVRDGVFNETAYYTSAHPALRSDEMTSAGKTYLRTMLEAAAAELDLNDIPIEPDIVDVAEHLCIVEHTDHKRFLNEDHAMLFPEILSLYALNQGNTYRYSVSSAGAGGMIQMIPQTYQAIRQQHPNVRLEADFVTGMRDHANALKAMLLYMNDTWVNLQHQTEVQDALRNGIATKTELLAAGYNSNPTRLAGYLKNGGVAWRTLIPAETQMYLAIYGSLDSSVQFGQKENAQARANTVSISPQLGPAVARLARGSLLTWLSRALISNRQLLF